MSRGISNATVESVSLQIDRGFAVTIWLNVKHESGSQGFGGYCLAHVDRDPSPHLAAWVVGLMRLFGVERWEDIAGKPCRVDSDFGRIYRVGHFLKDEWFDPEEVHARLEAKR